MIEVGITLILIGIALILLSILFSLFITVGRRKEVRGGGVVIIGPFPILFASDKEVAKLALILTLVSIMVFLFLILLFNISPFS